MGAIGAWGPGNTLGRGSYAWLIVLPEDHGPWANPPKGETIDEAIDETIDEAIDETMGLLLGIIAGVARNVTNITRFTGIILRI